VRLLDSCGRPEWKYPAAQTLQLQSRDKQFKTIKVFHDISLPAPWVKRVRELNEQDWNRDNDFFKKPGTQSIRETSIDRQHQPQCTQSQYRFGIHLLAGINAV